MKKIVCFVLVLAASLCVSSVSFAEEMPPVDEGTEIVEVEAKELVKPPENHVDGDLYISFTVTSAKADNSFTSRVYYYNLKEEKLEKIASVPYTSQYPYTVYDKNDNMVYYSYRKANTGNDQLYSYNLKSKKTKRLTETLFAMNYIIPEAERILLITIPLKAEDFALCPIYYEKQTGKLERLDWDRDLTIRNTYSNPRTKEFTVSAFSSSEYWKRMGEQDIRPYTQPPISIYKIVNEKESVEKLFELEDGVFVQSVTHMGSMVVYATKKSFDAKATKFYAYDSTSGETTPYTYGEKLGKFFDFVYITDDGRYIYYLGYKNNNSSGKDLCRYDTVNDEKKVIYSSEIGYETVNNAVILADC